MGVLVILMLFLFGISFSFYLNDANLRLITKYSHELNCADIAKQHNEDELALMSADAWSKFEKSQSNTVPGIVDCFCAH